MPLSQTIVGIAANLTAVALFLSPASTFLKIYKQKSTEEFSAIPYLCTLFQALLWLFYGSPWVYEGILVMTINGFAALLEGVYVILFIWYAKDRRKRWETVGILMMIVSSYAIVVCLTLSIVPHGQNLHTQRKTIVGIICVIVNGLMYASPLTITWLVIKTRSTVYMPFFLSLFSLLNGILWTLYAVVATFDIYILIPNVAGIVLSTIQLLLYAYFRNSNEGVTKVPGSARTAEKQDQDLELAHQRGATDPACNCAKKAEGSDRDAKPDLELATNLKAPPCNCGKESRNIDGNTREEDFDLAHKVEPPMLN